MPLDAQRGPAVQKFSGFNHPVGADGAYQQARRQCFDRLVMAGVDPEGIGMYEGSKQGIVINAHGMRAGVPLLVRNLQVQLRVQVLVEGAAHRNVDGLNAPADREEGLAPCQHAPDERDIHPVTFTAFQKINNLATDGIAGSRTLSVLYGANAKSNTPSAPLDQPFVPLTVGSKGSEVSSVQQRLITLKYLTGNADGIFGPRTFLAVKAFQERNRLDADGIVGKLTLAAINSSKAIAAAGVIPPVVPGPTVPDGGGDTFTPPKASEVRFANWYKEIRSQAQSMRNVIVYDFISGTHYNFRFFSLGKHADGTTLTKGDTAVMNAALGVNNWTPRPVWVIFSNGRVYMASTHSHGHEVDYISGNNLTGHLCVHFPRDMAEAAQTGPYAVSHQNAILAGWDLTQNMAR